MKFLVKNVKHNYIQPTFITDYPVEMSPLCKKHRDNPELPSVLSLFVKERLPMPIRSSTIQLINESDLKSNVSFRKRVMMKLMFIDQIFDVPWNMECLQHQEWESEWTD